MTKVCFYDCLQISISIQGLTNGIISLVLNVEIYLDSCPVINPDHSAV